MKAAPVIVASKIEIRSSLSLAGDMEGPEPGVVVVLMPEKLKITTNAILLHHSILSAISLPGKTALRVAKIHK